MKNVATLFCGKVTLLSAFFMFAAGCTAQQEKPKILQQSVKDTVSESTMLVATIPADVTPPKPIPGHESAPAAQGQPSSFQIIFSESGKGVAYVAGQGDGFYVMHNQERGKVYSAVGTVVLSQDGRRSAYAAEVDGKWCMVLDGQEGKRYDSVLTPAFSPDGRHIVCQGKAGDKWYMLVDGFPNEGTTASYTTPEFNSDSNLIVYTESASSINDTRLIVSDLSFRKRSVITAIGDQLFVTNKGKNRIAAVQLHDSKFRVVDFKFDKPDVVHEGPLYDFIEQLALSDDGVSLSYCALKGRTRLMILDAREELLPVGRAPELPMIRPDKKGVGILLSLDNRISFYQTFIGSKVKGKIYDEASNLTYSTNGSYAYAARTGNDWFVVVNGKEGTQFDRVVDPLFSPDGRYLVYRARKGKERFLVLADAKDGKVIKQYPSCEQEFQPSILPGGKGVAYGVKDGSKLVRKVEPL